LKENQVQEALKKVTILMPTGSLAGEQQQQQPKKAVKMAFGDSTHSSHNSSYQQQHQQHQ
jgi:hypothetical protein